MPLNLKISRQIKGVLQVTSQSFRDLKVGSFINALDVVMCAVERTMRSGAEKSPAQPCLVCCHAVPAFTVRNCSRKKLMSLELIKFPEANSSPTEQGWLEDDCSLLGFRPIFRDLEWPRSWSSVSLVL